jgi:quinoprotein dehydrogenase-associated probable ABC transporter substrate-binding protein
MVLGAAMAALFNHAVAADTGATAPQGDKPVLAVCADPSNLPYSNEKQEGFENKIAAVLAADMRAEVRYFWFAEHKTFFRRTLLDGLCDVVISVPDRLQIVGTTKPYFTSTYVAVTRAKDNRVFKSFDDPWLSEARIGLQLVGNDGATTPPAMSLARRGINRHITGFQMWSGPDDPDPQGKIIDAVADGSIDVALVWGPFAGYFAKAHGADLRISAITADPLVPGSIFAFPMALGVRKSDTVLRDRLQLALDRHQPEIEAILRDYGIPLVSEATPRAAPVTQ